MPTFTDAEQRFADSPQGQSKVAQARRNFQLRNAYLRDQAPKWTDAMEANAIRDLTTIAARDSIGHMAIATAAEREEPGARVAREAAYVARKIEASNAWRQG